MWKWIVGILLALILLVMGAAWWGFQKVAGSFSPDGSVRVAIAATPARVFASLSDADSAATWMARGNTVFTGKHGTFVPGDSVRIEMRSVGGMTGRPVIWKVIEVVPGQSVAWQLESPDPRKKFTAIRRDSIAQVGDSTIVVSRVTSAAQASATSEQLVLSMFKVQSKLELMSLKSRIEERATTRSP